MTLIPAGTRFEGIPVGTRIDLRSEQINDSLTVYTMDDIATTVAADLPPSGLQGESFILVKGDKSTPQENGLDLQAAYDLAQAATPYGDALSASNRFTIIVAPGDYYSDYSGVFGPIGQFQINADFIDIISLTGNSDVYLSGISVSAQDVYLKGLNTTQAGFMGGAQAGFDIAISSAQQTFDTCVGGNYSFGWGGDVYSKFVNCKGGNYSFCATAGASAPIGITPQLPSPNLAGILIDCTAGNSSFASSPSDYNTSISGTLTNCTAGNNSFGSAPGSFYGNISGILTNCTGGELSFSIWGNISGTLTNCKSTGQNSFGGYVGATGIFYNCIGVDNSFAGQFMQAFEGKAYNCIGGLNTFGNYDAGPGSPANFISTFAGGRVSYCTKTTGVFSGASGSGPNTVIACQDSAGLKTF